MKRKDLRKGCHGWWPWGVTARGCRGIAGPVRFARAAPIPGEKWHDLWSGIPHAARRHFRHVTTMLKRKRKEKENEGMTNLNRHFCENKTKQKIKNKRQSNKNKISKWRVTHISLSSLAPSWLGSGTFDYSLIRTQKEFVFCPFFSFFKWDRTTKIRTFNIGRRLYVKATTTKNPQNFIS